MILNICNDGDVLSALRIVKILINIIRIIVPIILIISLLLGYIGVISSNDIDKLSKMNKTAIIKVIASVIIFFIPTLVNIVSNIVDPNDNLYVSCINNATSESIDEAYIESSRKYIAITRESLNRSDYLIASREIRKVKNSSDRDELNSELLELEYYIDIKDRINRLSNDRNSYNSIKNEIEKISDEKIREKLMNYLMAHFGAGRPLNVAAGVYERSDYDSEMRYVEVIPEDATTNMPVIFYLHGLGSYSNFSSEAPNYKITNYVKSNAAYSNGKFILIIPRVVISQGDANNMINWQTNQAKEQARKLKGLIDFISNKYSVDSRKIIITGFSLGGDGVWSMIETYPDLFAAGVVVSGCAGRNPNINNFTSTAIIAYHGTGAREDSYKQCVPAVYNRIKSAGGNIELRVKRGYSHAMMQNIYTENDGEIFKWMLDQSK